MDWMDDFEADNGLYAASFANSARVEPEEYPWNAEVLPLPHQRGEAERGAHNAFEDLARVYGLKRASELWSEIPKEYDRD